MTIHVRGADWHYTLKGDGEPVLFLHGGLDAAVNHSRLTDGLAEHFRVVAVDRRGHGGSTDTDAPFDFSLMAEEVLEFTRKLALPPFHLVGYSDGANIGFHLASDHPEAVKSFVALSGNYKGLSGMSPKWLAMIPRLSPAYAREHMPQVMEQYAALNPAPDPESYILKTRDLWLQDTVVSVEKLAAIRAKTLLIAGDRDIVLPEQTLAMYALIPNAALMILPWCNHFIFPDFAWGLAAETALPVIRRLLSGQPA
ncbi:MAG: alpha/beta hydrolase [Deltaproteobacteria bacterium]|jgi:pimeloyl-ACP methyl ester carboxylesterase|nr:alpha/beta hydrolase [Deltaproteobacteria bacterium]